MTHFNSLRPRQNECQFADDISKCIFLNENVQIPIEISLKFVPKGPTNNIPALVQIMVRHQPGDEPLSELMMVSLLMHIWVTRPELLKLYMYVHKARQLAVPNTILAYSNHILGINLLGKCNYYHKQWMTTPKANCNHSIDRFYIQFLLP